MFSNCTPPLIAAVRTCVMLTPFVKKVNQCSRMSSNTLAFMGHYLGSFRSADLLTWPPKSFALTLAQIMVFQEGLNRVVLYSLTPDRHNQAGSTQVPMCCVPPRIHPTSLKSGKTSCVPFLPLCAPISTQPYAWVLRLALAQAEGA